ncbi:MAG: prolipoprotein diacylglyceryl transferase, partial [Candidatus Kerfeldbacteria bacterium]|nr:prolipoprotein diacylglyceryl transferase [Candidatus Kerfeldbacteria bacterium]
MFFHTWHPQAVLLTIGPLELRWYGLMLAIGTLVGYLVVLAIAKRARLNTNQMTDLFLWLLVFGFIGARLYHVLNEWSFYQAHPDMILKVWNGGLAIHGAIIAGLITLWVNTQRQRESIWLTADVL